MVFEDKSLAPYHGREPFIFISYSHRNSDQAAEIISTLNRAGFRVWYDEGLIPGREWDENIARIIMGCSYFIALLTEEYLASSNCKDELNYARDKNKPIVLIYLDEVTLPAGMELRLGRLFAVHRQQYATEETFYSKVFSADGIARCNSRYNPSSVSRTFSSSARSERATKRQAPVKTAEPVNDRSSSGSGLRFFGIILLLLLIAGTFFLLYRFFGTSNESQSTTSYSVQTVIPTEPSHEAELDIETTPEPEPSVVVGEEIEPSDETYSVPEPTAELIVTQEVTPTPLPTPEPAPSPTPTPEPTPSPTPMPEATPSPTPTPIPEPVIEPTPVSEPENVVIIDTSSAGGTGSTMTTSGSAAVPAG